MSKFGTFRQIGVELFLKATGFILDEILLQRNPFCGIMNRKKEVCVMSDIDSIVREVGSSMAMEGMPLFAEDRERIRRCLTDMGNLEKMIGSLVEKHKVPAKTGKSL